MAARRNNPVIQHLRRVVPRPDTEALTDGRLLECFITHRDDAAFAALVRKHGPMVLGVCRRLLPDPHDADDAFQATFLVLVRKAASVTPRDLVGNWLYGVAYQTAVRLRTTNAKRRQRERPVGVLPEPGVVPRPAWDDLRGVLDQELARLPEKFRLAVVLCDLEGKTRQEAARLLRWPEGTVSSRLSRARALLASRLTRRGVGVGGGALAAWLAEGGARARVSAAAVSAATRVAFGGAGLLPAQVAALTEGVLKAMAMTKLKVAAAVLLAAGLVDAGVGVNRSGPGAFVPAGAQAAAEGPATPPEPEPSVGQDAGLDLLRAARERMRVEEQRLTQIVEAKLRQARDGRPDAALTLLRDTLVQVWDNPDISEQVREALLTRLLAGRRAVAEAAGKPAWTLGFRYKTARRIIVAVPGKGQQAFWYLWYEVVNGTEEAHTFVPEFEVVTADTVRHDEVVPAVQEAVGRLEDPAGTRVLKDSVTIARDPIPPSQPGATPKGVAGLAVCEDGDDAKTVTVFVRGLSNAWSAEGETVRRKVLKLTFTRLGDEFRPTGQAEWVYRPTRGEAKD